MWSQVKNIVAPSSTKDSARGSSPWRPAPQRERDNESPQATSQSMGAMCSTRRNRNKLRSPAVLFVEASQCGAMTSWNQRIML